MANRLILIFLLCFSVSAYAVDENKYDNLIQASADKYNIPFSLIKAVIKQESNFNPNAESPVGAVGLMQLMPGTASDMGVSDRTDPAQGIDGGTRYLKWLSDNYFGDDTVKILAAYNAGAGNVQKYNGVPPFSETINYVHNVLEYYNAFGGPKVDTSSVPTRGSGGSGGRPPSASSPGDPKVGNPSILSISDSTKIISEFESYLGTPQGLLRQVFLGATTTLLLIFGAIQFIWFFGMPISGSLSNASGIQRLVTPAALTIRTMVLVGFLSFFIINSFT